MAHALRLRRANETSLSGDTAATEVRSLVAESWRRSLAAGVTPEARE